jgi:hypothetical protein
MAMEKQGVIDENTPDEPAPEGKQAAACDPKDHPTTRAAAGVAVTATAKRGCRCCERPPLRG